MTWRFDTGAPGPSGTAPTREAALAAARRAVAAPESAPARRVNDSPSAPAWIVVGPRGAAEVWAE